MTKCKTSFIFKNEPVKRSHMRFFGRKNFSFKPFKLFYLIKRFSSERKGGGGVQPPWPSPWIRQCDVGFYDVQSGSVNSKHLFQPQSAKCQMSSKASRANSAHHGAILDMGYLIQPALMEVSTAHLRSQLTPGCDLDPRLPRHFCQRLVKKTWGLWDRDCPVQLIPWN